MDFDIPADIQSTLDELDAFIEARDRSRSQAQDDNDPLLRPPARVRPHRLRERRRAPRRSGRTLLREMRRRADAAGWLRCALPEEFGGRGRQQPRDGDHPRAPGRQGPRAAQRPAERELDRRQLPDRADDARLRHRGAEGRVDARVPRRHPPARLRPHRAEPRLRRHLPRDHRRARRRRVGASTGTKRFNSGLHHATHDIIFARTSGDPGSPVGITRLPRAHRRARASASTSSGGRSTCPPTTPRSR